MPARVRCTARRDLVNKDVPKESSRTFICEVSDEGVSLREAIREAICLEIVTRGDEKRVITILRGLGYEPMDRNENGKRVRRYVRPGARGETPADFDVRTLLGQRLCEHLHALLDTLEMEMPGLVRMYLDGKK